jgi:hypothetical protein
VALGQRRLSTARRVRRSLQASAQLIERLDRGLLPAGKASSTGWATQRSSGQPVRLGVAETTAGWAIGLSSLNPFHAQ